MATGISPRIALRVATSPLIRDALQVVARYARGVVWYHIRVVENEKQWLVKKTFNEFAHLDAMLSTSTSPFVRPPFPEKGRLPFHHFLGECC